MSAVLIQQDPAALNQYFLSTETGRDVHVWIKPWGGVNVSCPTNARPVPAGRNFATLADAVEGFKAADVKAALRVLISELV